MFQGKKLPWLRDHGEVVVGQQIKEKLEVFRFAFLHMQNLPGTSFLRLFKFKNKRLVLRESLGTIGPLLFGLRKNPVVATKVDRNKEIL